jgi:mannose-6-phosphate isomerase
MNAPPDRRAVEAAARRPFPLPYHPLYRFYDGGALTRQFRGLPDAPDDHWSEDWVGSCTEAGNADPDGRPQGLSVTDVDGIGPVAIQTLIEVAPEAMVGAAFAAQWGPTSDVLVKLLSPAGQVPLHAHPTRAWARQHLGSRFGKTEAWIILDAPGDGREPAYAGVGFRPGIDRAAFGAAARGHDQPTVRSTLHRFEVAAGEVYVAHGGVPHYLGPRISFIEVQEPTDQIVIAETDGADDAGATMGLGWDLALDMIDYEATDRDATLKRARQGPRVLRESHGSGEIRLFQDDVGEFFDATRLEVEGEIAVEDGRFYIGIVTRGSGTLEGDFGSMPVQHGETFACAASMAHRFRSGTEPLTVVRCLGPRV